MLKNKYFLPIIFLLAPVVVLAGDYKEVEIWLQKMHKAAHTLNYMGKFVYQQEKQLSLMQIIHAADSKGERERLISLDDTGREVIRTKDKVTCILPDSKSVVVDKGRPDPQFPPAFPMKLENVKDQYSFFLDKQEKVAGQQTQKIVIHPNDRFRYGHRLWVDTKTGLLLKTHLYDETGETLEQFMFTEISFVDTVPEEMLNPHISTKEYTWYVAGEDSQKEDKKQHVMGWAIKKLPAGFSSDMKRHHNMPNKTAVEHLIFSDGFSSVSVFIEKHKDKGTNMVGASRMGAVNAYGRKLDKHHVTAVGEVPRATVKLISESVVRDSK